jgi:hypothetical protein
VREHLARETAGVAQWRLPLHTPPSPPNRSPPPPPCAPEEQSAARRASAHAERGPQPVWPASAAFERETLAFKGPDRSGHLSQTSVPRDPAAVTRVTRRRLRAAVGRRPPPRGSPPPRCGWHKAGVRKCRCTQGRLSGCGALPPSYRCRRHRRRRPSAPDVLLEPLPGVQTWRHRGPPTPCLLARRRQRSAARGARWAPMSLSQRPRPATCPRQRWKSPTPAQRDTACPISTG